MSSSCTTSFKSTHMNSMRVRKTRIMNNAHKYAPAVGLRNSQRRGVVRLFFSLGGGGGGGKRNKKTEKPFRLHGFRKQQQQQQQQKEEGASDKNKNMNETTIEFIKSLVSGSYYEKDEEIDKGEFSAVGGNRTEGLVRRGKPTKGLKFFKPGLRKLTARQRMALAFSDLDSSGWWAVISSGIVFGTFILETYNIGTFGGWDVLYRDDIPWYSGLVSMDNIREIENAYNALFFFELMLLSLIHI